MRLSALLRALPPAQAPQRVVRAGSDDDPVVRGIAYDSRSVAPGDVFFALRGADADGHDYLDQALDLGASVLFVEELPKEFDLRARVAAIVPDARRSLAPAAVAFFGSPADELLLVGVTGTNGKTSTSYLCCRSRLSGLVGTVEVRFADQHRRATNTTPESLDLQHTLREMRTAGVTAAVMEVSSHGLELGRVEGCHFEVACFTNLTQDHLDFHGDMDTYRSSKELLFREYLAADATAVVNVDDPAAGTFLEAARSAGARTLGVSRLDRAADIALHHAQVDLSGTRARIGTPDGILEVTLPLIGEFNLENLLVACGAGLAAGASIDDIVRGVESCPQVPGRVERVGADIDGAPTVLVDYAHTPDAVEKVAAALRPLCDGRLIAVFGCGGDRDRAKRPLMAQAVARHADRIVATSDNPRTEDPERILDDVVRGLSGLDAVAPQALDAATGAYARITDRREAIALAIAIARAEDTVLIAGKGHEDYQILGREKRPFDDRLEARKALEARGTGAGGGR